MPAGGTAPPASTPTGQGGGHEVSFYHRNPDIGSYVLNTGLDDIEWGYNLNVAVFPTYAGEVIQILSVFIDDITITGSLKTYAQMEDLYTYFMKYMQIATQGRVENPEPGEGSYNQDPIQMHYPHRGWHFDLQLKSAPGFRYGRDVVHPMWRLQAHMVDTSINTALLEGLVVDQVMARSGDDDFSLEGKIGYKQKNPYSDPFPTEDGAGGFNAPRAREYWKKYGDDFVAIIDAYTKGEFETLTQGGTGSKPPWDIHGMEEPPDPEGEDETTEDGSAGQNEDE